ncbi:MAG: ATP-binding protein [Alphaproteobacteria bacterium]|nr:ATP-binding protein [Alphaproteobacteria bacterium]
MQARADAMKRLGSLRIAIERVLNYDVQRARGLVGYVINNPSVTNESFSKVARYLIGNDTKLIRNISLAQGYVVSHVYPYETNAAVLGIDYHDIPEQWPMVQHTVQQNAVTLAGPVKLVQGGTGLIARYPVFLNDEVTEPRALWGLASLVIDYHNFLEYIHVSNYQAEFDLALFGADATGMDRDPFLGNVSIMEKSPVSVEVLVPGGSWVIVALPKGGWPSYSGHLWHVVILMIVVFGIGSAIVLTSVRFESALVKSAKALELSRNEAKRAQIQAEQANRTKSLFLANMSHELRTPLNAIIGFSEIMSHELMGKIGNDRYKGYATDIYNSSNHLMEVLSDILDITRIESGDLELNETTIAPSYLMETAVRLIRDPFEKKGLTLDIHVPDTLPDIQVDARLMRQVLVNTIENAIKYTHADTVISITAEMTNPGGVTFSIRDAGPGIPFEEQARILEPFVQIRPTAEVTFEGAGLGLPIAKKLMEAHGGSLSITSEFGQWTCVTLTVPSARVMHPA